jgi:hypothetical protein
MSAMMSEILRYQKELDELKLDKSNPTYKIKKICEYVKNVLNSSLPNNYKEVFIREAKNEIPLEISSENELDPLICIAGAIGGNFFYDAVKHALYSLVNGVKNSVREEGVKVG